MRKLHNIRIVSYKILGDYNLGTKIFVIAVADGTRHHMILSFNWSIHSDMESNLSALWCIMTQHHESETVTWIYMGI